MEKYNKSQIEITKELGEIMRISYKLDLVNLNAKTNVKKLIELSEKYYNEQVKNIVEDIASEKHKLVFVCGPSSAGKTTTSNKIKLGLKKHNIKSYVISMDDFFVNLIDTPKLPNGQYDLDGIEAIDKECFMNFVKSVLNNKPALLPHYDFVKDKRTSTKIIKFAKDEIIIIEGIHALNPIFNNSFKNEKIYKVFVAVASNFVIGNRVIINAKQLRLIRRMLRDYYKRGDNANDTIRTWQNVCIAEEKHILPYKHTVDYIINTTHMYEPLVYDKLLKPILKSANKSPEIKELIEIFNNTGTIDCELIPKSSLIQEFLPD